MPYTYIYTIIYIYLAHHVFFASHQKHGELLSPQELKAEQQNFRGMLLELFATQDALRKSLNKSFSARIGGFRSSHGQIWVILDRSGLAILKPAIEGLMSFDEF